MQKLTVICVSQMNQITHWMDASSIYGSSDAESLALRELRDGQLKIGRVAGSRLGLLPSCSLDRSQSVGMCSGCPKCFFAGPRQDCQMAYFQIKKSEFG
jgi:hypothetical protein